VNTKKSYSELVSLLKKEREKNLVADKLIDSFISNILHEIRTPMNAIIGFSQLLEEMEDADQQTFREFTSVINEKGNELVSLFDDLIKLSEVESGIYKPDYSNFRFGEVISSFEEKYKPGKNNKQFVIFELDEDLKYEVFHTDMFLLKMLFTKLIENARLYTHKGFIKIVIKIKDNGFLEILVENASIDFPIHNPNHLKQSGSKVNKSGTNGGTGIGLAITKRIVNLLGGSLWFEYLEEFGAKVKLEIPVFSKNDEKINHSSSYTSAVDWSDKQILVATETKQNFYDIESSLKKTQIKIERVNSGEEAVKYCQSEYSEKLNLILLDFQSSFSNGYETTKELKRLLNNTPVVTCTKSSDFDTYMNVKNAGADGFLFSPLSPIKIINKLSNFIIGV
jgi:CheY-like chemotaxis protein